MCQFHLPNYTVTELNLEVIDIKEPTMQNNDHISKLCSIASFALSIISLILMFYGAWLFDQQLATKVQVFTSMSIPLAGSIICAIIASLKNWRK